MSVSYLVDSENENSDFLLGDEVVYRNLSSDIEDKSDESLDKSEDNIIKLISNIKVIKEEAYEEDNEELDMGMQAFLVEALNESCKIRREEQSKSSKEDRSWKEARDKQKLEREAKIKFSADNIKPNIFNDISLNCDLDSDRDIEENNNLKLEEISEEISELKIEEEKDKKESKFEIIDKKAKDKAIEEKKERELDDIVIEKLIENNSYEKFYKVIRENRNTQLNKRVIGLVAGMVVIVVAVLILVTEIVTASAVI